MSSFLCHPGVVPDEPSHGDAQDDPPQVEVGLAPRVQDGAAGLPGQPAELGAEGGELARNRGGGDHGHHEKSIGGAEGDAKPYWRGFL